MKNMRSLILFLSVLMLVGCSTDSKKETIKPIPTVDERTELLSIVFQLAGAEEYAKTFVASYASDIAAYFEPYKNHELIKWIPGLRQEYGIGYDAVMGYAIRLKIENGKIGFLDKINIEDFDSRWKKDVAEQFLVKLNEFYTESRFNEFFTQHKPLYAAAEENFLEVLNQVDFDWFEQYYGTMPEGKFHLIISITNGMGNYGPSISYTDGKKDPYAIIGTWTVDDKGNPIYPDRVLSLIIHEFNHPFCNPLVYEFYSGMEEKLDEFYGLTPDIFNQQAYGDAKIVMCEMLVRASVIQYYKNTGEQQRANEITKYEQKQGFSWIETLCNKLDEYEQQRDKYTSLHSFMPEIVEMINGLTFTEQAE